MILYMLFAVGTPNRPARRRSPEGNHGIDSQPSREKIPLLYLCRSHYDSRYVFLVLVMFMGTVVSSHLFDFGEPIDLSSFFKVAINDGLLAAAVGGIALLAAACFQRATAVWVTVTYLVVKYFVTIMADWWPPMFSLKPVTLFHDVNGLKKTSIVWPGPSTTWLSWHRS